LIKYISSIVKEADYGDLLARPHLEAVITDIANLYCLDKKKLRSRIKRKLQVFKYIKKSTTELSENQLKELANRFSTFYFSQTEKENNQLDELNLNNIILQ